MRFYRENRLRGARAGSGPAHLRHEVAYRTDIGHVHRVNQDAGGAWMVARENGVPATLLVVADGVSSGKRSEEASRLVVDAVSGRVLPLLPDASHDLESLLAALTEATLEANHAVAILPHSSAETADATTIAAVVALGERLAGLWCGDSRVYLVAERVRMLTRDHSWAELVTESGLMTAEEAAKDPRAHAITRWIGPPDQDDPGIDVFRADLRAGETVVCCSDGLYRYFQPPKGDPEEMRRELEAAPLSQAVDALVRVALRRGGTDNVTIAALRALEAKA